MFGAVQDLLFSASGRHLPLVIHLTNSTVSGHGMTPGTGHEGYHMSCDSGVFTLFAENAQQAADFSLIARRVAEATLIPGLVVMDANETAWSLQDVSILSPSKIARFIGPASASVSVTSEAQKLIFGDTRLAVPRWHDVDRPVLAGAVFDPESYSKGALARNLFFEDRLAETLKDVFDEFKRLTGRQYQNLSTYKVDGAQTVFVAQGAAVETAITVADSQAKTQAQIGVIGVTSLRPFPLAELKSALKGKPKIAVLERILPAPGAETPLLREIRHALEDSQASTIHSIRYGIGGASFTAADLAIVPSFLAERSLTDSQAESIHLGIDFEADASNPKRQVLYDQLMRAYPDIATTGLCARDVGEGVASLESASEGTVSIAIQRAQASGYKSLLADVSDILHKINGGTVRSRYWLSQGSWSDQGADFLIHSNSDLVEPGDEALLDMLCLTLGSKGEVNPVDAALIKRLRKGGTIIVPGPANEELAKTLMAPFGNVVTENSLRFFAVPITSSMGPSAIEETITGAIFGAIVKSKLLTLKERKVFSLREDTLRSMDVTNREERLELFKAGFANTIEIEFSASPVDSRTGLDVRTPAALQHLAAKDEQFDSLPRFWNQVGVLYNNKESGKLTPDPYLASGTIAPLSSTFRDFTDQRSMIPVIDTEKCTGCGKCWTSCPDSALAPVAISPSALIDHGIRQGGADSLRQVANQLSARVLSQARKKNLGSNAGTILRDTYSWLSEKLELAPDRKQAVDEAVDLVCDGIGSLPISITDVLFDQAESNAKDSGELLSLVVNPDTCKDCGLCETVCEPDAITFVPQTEEVIGETRKAWDVWATVPDTAATTIERVAEGTEIDSMAALNLSRHCLLSMAGGDGAEPGSGEKIALRMALAATEFQQQPLMRRFSADIADTTNDLIKETRGVLSLDLEQDDLDLLSKSIDNIKAPLVELSTLIKNVEDTVDANPVDTARLGRLLDIANRLTDLQSRLTSGRQGLGRSRFGLAIAPGSVASWAVTYPYNSFQSPVTVDFSNETAQLAAGLLEGHLRDTCETIALIRQARLEIDQPGGYEFTREALAHLSWQDLTEEEREVCPPMLIVGNDDILGGDGLAQLLWSLNSDLPIKVLSFADLDFGLTESHQQEQQYQDPRANTGLLAIACRSAYVAQTSIANPEHFQRSIAEAIQFSGPAFIRIHSPSPYRHGFESDQTIGQAELAVRSRAFPLFNYNPALDGVYGTRLDISANHQPAEESDEESNEESPFTFAHWAATESRFASHFQPSSEADAVELNEYIGLNERSRKGKSAFISIQTGDNADVTNKQLFVDEALINATKAAQDNWQVLEELSGIVTPFTSLVEEQVKEKVQTEHEAEIATIKADYEKQLSELSDNVRSDMAGTVRAQLVRLVNSARSQAK